MEAKTIEAVAQALQLPFAPSEIDVKPGATSEEKQSALALPYADARAYQERLDAVVGQSNWTVSYAPWGDRAIICTLTILGVTRQDVGEGEMGDPNQATSAAMQAFKRSCSAFGLGRYLYNLPKIWVPAERRGKTWVIKDPAAAVARLYAEGRVKMEKQVVYIARINQMLGELEEAELVELGKHIKQTQATKARAAQRGKPQTKAA